MPIEEFMPKEPPPPPEPSAAVKPVEKKGMLARLTKARTERPRGPKASAATLPLPAHNPPPRKAGLTRQDNVHHGAAAAAAALYDELGTLMGCSFAPTRRANAVPLPHCATERRCPGRESPRPTGAVLYHRWLSRGVGCRRPRQ
jgi:hypothetical protein